MPRSWSHTPRLSRFVRAARLFLTNRGIIAASGLLALTPLRAFAATSSCGTWGGWLNSPLKCMVTSAIGGVIGTVVDVLVYIGYAMAFFLGWVVSVVVKLTGPFVKASNEITALPEVRIMWSNVRDLSNALLILVLLVAAILVIIRYEKGNYTVKQVLPKVVYAVLLINFSKLIVQVVVDFFHVLTVGTYDLLVGPVTINGTNTQITEMNAVEGLFAGMRLPQLLTQIAKNTDSVTGEDAILVNTQLFIATLLVLGLMVIIAFAAVSVLILYATRIIALGLLTIVSPLAILASVLPQTQQYAKKFWSELIKYALIPATLAVFFSFAIRVNVLFQNLGETVDRDQGVFAKQMDGMPNIQWSTLINIIIATMVIKAGLKAAKSGTLAEGAVDAVQGYADKLNKKGVDGMKWAARKTPVVPGLKRDRSGNITGPTLRSYESASGGWKKVLGDFKTERGSQQGIKDDQAAADIYAGFQRRDGQAPGALGKLIGIRKGKEGSYLDSVQSRQEDDAKKSVDGMQRSEFMAKVKDLKVTDEESLATFRALQNRLKNEAERYTSKDLKSMDFGSKLAQADTYLLNRDGADKTAERERLFDDQKAVSKKNPRLAYQDFNTASGAKVLARFGDEVIEDPNAPLRLTQQQFLDLDQDDRAEYLQSKKIQKQIVDSLLDPRNATLLANTPKGGELLISLQNAASPSGGYVQNEAIVEGTIGMRGRHAPDAAKNADDATQRRLEEHRATAGTSGVAVGDFLQEGGSRNLSVDFHALEESMPGIAQKAGTHLNTKSAEGKQVVATLADLYEQQLIEDEMAKAQPEIEAEVERALAKAVEDALATAIDEQVQLGADPQAARAQLAPGVNERVRSERAEPVRTQVTASRMQSVSANAATQRQAFERSMQQKKGGITLINKARTGRDAKHILRHEANHSAMERVGEQRIDEYRRQLSEKMRTEINTRISAFQDTEGMDENAKLEEYLAEALANLHTGSEQNGIEFDRTPEGDALLHTVLSDMASKDPRQFYSTVRGLEITDPARLAELLADTGLRDAYAAATIAKEQERETKRRAAGAGSRTT